MQLTYLNRLMAGAQSPRADRLIVLGFVAGLIVAGIVFGAVATLYDIRDKPHALGQAEGRQRNTARRRSSTD